MYTRKDLQQHRSEQEKDGKDKEPNHLALLLVLILATEHYPGLAILAAGRDARLVCKEDPGRLADTVIVILLGGGKALRHYSMPLLLLDLVLWNCVSYCIGRREKNG